MRSIVDTRRKVSFVTGFLYAASKQNPQTKPTADVVIDSGFSCGSSGSSGSTIDQTSPNSKSTKSNDKFNYFIDKENDDIWENRISNRHRIKLLKRQLSDDLDVEYTSEHVLQNILKNNNSGLALLAHKVDQVWLFILCSHFNFHPLSVWIWQYSQKREKLIRTVTGGSEKRKFSSGRNIYLNP